MRSIVIKLAKKNKENKNDKNIDADSFVSSINNQ